MRGASSRASGTARHVKLAPAPTRRGLLPADGGHRLRRAPPSRGRAARARAERNAEMLTHTADGPVWFVGEGDRLPHPVSLGWWSGPDEDSPRPSQTLGPHVLPNTRSRERKDGPAGSLPLPGLSVCLSARAHMFSAGSRAVARTAAGGPAQRPGGLAGARGPAGPSPAPGGVRAASPGAERGLRDGCLCPRARPADALPPGRASRA